MINAIDLFCGIGGLTKGLTLANINVVAGIDNDATCEFAYETNNHTDFICENVEDISGDDLRDYYPQEGIKLLVGCAPCQPFSRYSSRYRKNGHKDEKWKLLYEFKRLVNELNPDIVSMENVPNLRNEGVFADFRNGLLAAGYHVWNNVVYCPDYGVPQNRKRLVLLASRLGEIQMIPPIYNATNYPTVRMAIGDLPPIENGETCADDPVHRASGLSAINLRRIRQSVPGGTWRDWDEDLRASCHVRTSGQTFPSVYGRMEWDKPSPTITTQFYGYGNGRFGHPDQDRAISLREGALLQSFPRDYVFFDEAHPLKKRELGMHIGNAVPVELGRAIGLSIVEHVRGCNDENNFRQNRE
jgi:DNA (cytosine-5)-methyltransferase 1